MGPSGPQRRLDPSRQVLPFGLPVPKDLAVLAEQERVRDGPDAANSLMAPMTYLTGVPTRERIHIPSTFFADDADPRAAARPSRCRHATEGRIATTFSWRRLTDRLRLLPKPTSGRAPAGHLTLVRPDHPWDFCR